MVGDGEAMGLVAQVLKQVERRGGARENDGELLPGNPHLLQALGQTDERHVDAELVEDGTCGIDLRQTAVDDDQPGCVGEAPGLAGLGVDRAGGDGDADLRLTAASGLSPGGPP